MTFGILQVWTQCHSAKLASRKMEMAQYLKTGPGSCT